MPWKRYCSSILIDGSPERYDSGAGVKHTKGRLLVNRTSMVSLDIGINASADLVPRPAFS
jgi:hypothetical protein